LSRDAEFANGERGKRQESVPELVKELTRDISELVRQEIELARVEMTEKGKKAGLGVGMFGGAAVLGMAVVGGSQAWLRPFFTPQPEGCWRCVVATS
jgi:hypothetical protein